MTDRLYRQATCGIQQQVSCVCNSFSISCHHSTATNYFVRLVVVLAGRIGQGYRKLWNFVVTSWRYYEVNITALSTETKTKSTSCKNETKNVLAKLGLIAGYFSRLRTGHLWGWDTVDGMSYKTWHPFSLRYHHHRHLHHYTTSLTHTPRACEPSAWLTTGT